MPAHVGPSTKTETSTMYLEEGWDLKGSFIAILIFSTVLRNIIGLAPVASTRGEESMTDYII